MTASLAERFTTFARTECSGGYAPLYERLSLAVAADAALLELAGHARAGQQPPNLLFAAVRRLLMDRPEHPLARFHPDIGAQPPQAGDDPARLFAEFCATHRDEVITLLETRLVQTNEPGRCLFVLPALIAAERHAGAPLAFIDAGCSAGFTLCFDHVAYDFGDGVRRGDAASPLLLSAEIRDGVAPPLPPPMPAVVARTGIDLNPLDTADPGDVAWLRALIWPERPARLAQLEQALAVVRAHPPAIVRGDLFDALPAAVAAAPPGSIPVVLTSFVLAHFTRERRAAFAELIETLSHSRPLIWLRSDRTGPHTPAAIEMAELAGGEGTHRVLAHHHAHGLWITWLPSNPQTYQSVCATPTRGRRSPS